jgi:tetratricopeptide (TPR) repeat protein
MSIDPYAPCPCGSGKQFKWCCQPFYGLVEKAIQQLQEGQKETALRTLDQLISQHPKVASVYGYKAQLLFSLEEFEKADETLQKAFEIDPNFALGHYLRGVVRQNEGEIIGALIQFRKAAELLDSNAHDLLASVNEAIADIELRLNHPVAARAAMEKARHHDSNNQELRTAFESIFGKDSRFPESAKKAYKFRSPTQDRAEAWKEPLHKANSGRLTDANKAFEQLTNKDPNDTAGWFNLGLVRAWLGDNLKAIEALEKSLDLEINEAISTDTSALIEVLRCGQGVGDQTDYLEHSVVFRLVDPNAVIGLLQDWERNGRLVGVRPDQQSGSLSALVLEDRVNLGMGIGNPVAPSAAYIFIVSDMLRLWHVNKELLERVATEMRLKLTGALMDAGSGSGPAQFGDVAVEAMSFPHQRTDVETIRTKMQEHAQQFFEEKWVNRSLRSLSGLSPIDAAQSPTYRKRLLGVIRFLEECFLGNAPRVQPEGEKQPLRLYEFDRLRRKLNLTTQSEPKGDQVDINVLSIPQLASLNRDSLTDEQLDQAFRAALRLDSQDLAGAFATTLTNRPANSTMPDRFVYFNHLIEQARQQNDTNAILHYLDLAEKTDQEGNEGKRLNDYTLRRAQTLAKRGEIDKAFETFETLIQRNPNEVKYYGTATESMLGLKQGPRALQFAEQGLAKARSQNNRDSEQYFLELIGAAKKQAGM